MSRYGCEIRRNYADIWTAQVRNEIHIPDRSFDIHPSKRLLMIWHFFPLWARTELSNYEPRNCGCFSPSVNWKIINLKLIQFHCRFTRRKNARSTRWTKKSSLKMLKARPKTRDVVYSHRWKWARLISDPRVYKVVDGTAPSRGNQKKVESVCVGVQTTVFWATT